MSKTELFIPYADTLALKQFDAQPDVVDFSLARKLAIIDLTVNKSWDRYGWSDGRLSSAPVAVYGFDGRPLFYDFIVLDANEGVFESYNEIQWFDTLFPIWGQK